MSPIGNLGTLKPCLFLQASWRFLTPLWVLPEYQKREVSTLLMKDVLDMADTQDPPIPVYLEAMPNARLIYEHLGFKGVEGKSVQMIRRWPKHIRKLAE